MFLTFPTLLFSVFAFLVIGMVANYVVWDLMFKKKVLKMYSENKNLYPEDFTQKKAMTGMAVFIFIAGIFLTILIALTKSALGSSGTLNIIHGFIMGLLVWMIGVVPPNLMWILYVRTPRDLMSINLLAWFFTMILGGMAISAIVM